MPNEVEKSLLGRLQALRGSSSTRDQPPAAKIDVDLIDRRKTPTGDDRLRDRLKSLRDGASTQSGKTQGSDTKNKKDLESEREASSGNALSEESNSLRDTSSGGRASYGASFEEKHPKKDSVNIDTAVFHTSDNDLEELLRDLPAEESFTAHQQGPDDAQVKALLEQLSDSIPKEEQRSDNQGRERVDEEDSSDGDNMKKEVDNVIARFRDELEMEKNLDRSPSPEPPEDQAQEGGQDENGALPEIPLPDVPGDPRSSTPNASSTIDDLTARLSALRAPSEDLSLPSVPSNKPAKGPKRLESRTSYTDADVNSWCTVCLADATLLCMGCEEKGEPYCTRCWREMHVGPAAAFDDRSHKAVQFGKRNTKEKKVALGA